MLAIEKIIACLLVLSREDPSADFRENSYFSIFVLKFQILVVPFHTFIGEIVIDRIRVNMTCRPLIRSSREEVRIKRRIIDKIGRNAFLCLHYLDLSTHLYNECQCRKCYQTGFCQFVHLELFF